MKEEPVYTRSLHGGTQDIYQFENGYGASVVCHKHSYGGNHGQFELAVIHFTGQSALHFQLDYSTPITDDVLGRLSCEEVQETLAQIKALPKYASAKTE